MKTNRTLTAIFIENSYPINLYFEIPAEKYIMKNNYGSKIRITPWVNSFTSAHRVTFRYHFDNEKEKAHSITLDGIYSNLESNSAGIKVKNTITASITIPKENTKLVIDQVSIFSVINEKGRLVNTESGLLKLGNKIIYSQEYPGGDWEGFSPTSWCTQIVWAASNIELLKTELSDGDSIQIMGYAAIIGEL